MMIDQEKLEDFKFQMPLVLNNVYTKSKFLSCFKWWIFLGIGKFAISFFFIFFG